MTTPVFYSPAEDENDVIDELEGLLQTYNVDELIEDLDSLFPDGGLSGGGKERKDLTPRKITDPKKPTKRASPKKKAIEAFDKKRKLARLVSEIKDPFQLGPRIYAGLGNHAQSRILTIAEKNFERVAKGLAERATRQDSELAKQAKPFARLIALKLREVFLKWINAPPQVIDYGGEIQSLQEQLNAYKAGLTWSGEPEIPKALILKMVAIMLWYRYGHHTRCVVS